MSDDGFVYRRRYTWVDYPEAGADDAPASHQPDYVGFRVELLANPIGGEINDEQQRWKALMAGKAPIEDYLENMGFRVRAWNYRAEDLASGEIAEVPAPAENWETFFALPNDLMWWVLVRARQIHVPKVTTRKSAPAGTTDTSTPTEIAPVETPLSD